MTYFHRPVNQTLCPICQTIISRVSESRTYLNKQPRCVNRTACAKRVGEPVDVDAGMKFLYGGAI